MRKNGFLIAVIVLLAAEIAALCLFLAHDASHALDAVAVNEILHAVEENPDAPEPSSHESAPDYVVLDADGNVRFRTKTGLCESIHDAVVHRDTILDFETPEQKSGKIIFYNDSVESLNMHKKTITAVFLCAVFVQCSLCIGYMIYLNRTIIRPFEKLKDFAERVACGNLDVPLSMDRKNIFGAFTESFDIMRCEIKRARIAEAQAAADKKELVAKLSHDIKTPVASIKAASEVGAALTGDEKLRDNYTQIIRKADQINALVSNLFSAALEELQQLTVTAADLASRGLADMLKDADYLHRAEIPAIPDCLLHADPLRLQQVFDNILSNSYKYADSPVQITAAREKNRLVITVEDCGGSLDPQELPLIKEKFMRGKNAGGIEGAGLGLYISDYFMKEMNGELLVENGQHGLRVSVCIALS